MKKLLLNQPLSEPAGEGGFIPLLLSILALVILGIVLTYLRVLHAQK
jgi:hypothetical protein